LVDAQLLSKFLNEDNWRAGYLPALQLINNSKDIALLIFIRGRCKYHLIQHLQGAGQGAGIGKLQ
jgi:hypothetical protein